MFNKQLDVFQFAELDSTNSYIKQNKHLIDKPALCFANKQLGGYGRFERSWFSTEEDLTFSLAVTFDYSLDQLVGISELVALTIYKNLQNYSNNLRVKWPNDLLLNDKKLGGILIEVLSTTNYQTTLVMGIGLNLSKPDTYIENSAGFIEIPDKLSLVYLLVNDLLDLAENYSPQLWQASLDKWQRADFFEIGAAIQIQQNNKVILGSYLGLDNQARLLLEPETSKEVLSFVSGEVSLRLQE